MSVKALHTLVCGLGILLVIYAQTALANTYTQSSCDVHIQGQSLSLKENCIRRTPELRQALVDMAVYLQTTAPHRLVSPDYAGPLDKKVLLRTVEQMIRWLDNTPGSSIPIGEQFDFYALGEPGSKRPVDYGAYYSPILEVSATRTTEFKYPIYGKPPANMQPYPPRRDIMQGALANRGLEIAWTNDLVAFYFMQIQGSGLIRYRDGQTQLLGFAGKNDHPYASIGRYMQEKGYLRTNNLSNNAVRQWLKLNPHKLHEILNANQSFVFFRPTNDILRAASGLPVIAGHTASVDTSMIPFGSILLAELPLRDNTGKIVQHEWRLLLATDRRTDAKGAVKIGIYTGTGEEARNRAQQFFPAGRAFLLHSSLKNYQSY